MMMNEEKESLTAAMHDVAWSLGTPSSETLYGGAIRRGRQIKRRQTVGASLGATVALATAAALAFTLGGADGSGRTATAAASGSGSPGPSASASASATVSASAGATPPDSAPPSMSDSTLPSALKSGGVLTTAQILHTYEGTLPRGLDILPGPGDSAPLTTIVQTDPTSGMWNAVAQVDVRVPSTGSPGSAEGSSVLGVEVWPHAWVESCADVQPKLQLSGSCSTSAVDGGTLITVNAAAAGQGFAAYWQYCWDSPSGYEVDFSIIDVDPVAIPLTVQQSIGVMTNPVWASIAARIPTSG